MALQEFLASYAVQVDEDGARRLQRILDQNRESGQQLAEVFSAAAEALASLKKELSQSSGLRNLFSWPLSSGFRLSASALSNLSGLSGSGQPGLSTLSASSASSGLSAGFSGPSSMSVGADFSAADEAFSSFRSRLETERPNIRVNTSGITSAVSSAIASVRSMLSSVQVTVPVTAVASLDISGLSAGGSGGGSSGGLNRKSGGGSDSILNRYGLGGRVDSPTLAMIAEEGKPEYVIPTDNEGRAVPLLRSLLNELSASARASLFSGAAGLQGSGAADSAGSTGSSSPAAPFALSGASASSDFSASIASFASAALAASSASAASAASLASAKSAAPSVQAPVNIYVSSSSASPEAVARSIYDTAQRSLLKTLKGVFA